MRRLTERAVDMADVSLFVIDGRVGVTPSDETFADILRKKGARVILAVNKAEGKAGDAGALEGWSLVWASRCGFRPNMARGWTIFTGC